MHESHIFVHFLSTSFKSFQTIAFIELFFCWFGCCELQFFRTYDIFSLKIKRMKFHPFSFAAFYSSIFTLSDRTHAKKNECNIVSRWTPSTSLLPFHIQFFLRLIFRIGFSFKYFTMFRVPEWFTYLEIEIQFNLSSQAIHWLLFLIKTKNSLKSRSYFCVVFSLKQK